MEKHVTCWIYPGVLEGFWRDLELDFFSDDDAKFERSFVLDHKNSPNMDSSNGHTLP